jgi:antitoxin component YwqK of YwqJK toxin-antitoxin module
MGRMKGRGKYYDQKGKVKGDYQFDNGLLIRSKPA